MKKLGAIVALVCLATLLCPWVAIAATAVHITITATGSDPLVLPGPPTNFTATLITNTQVDLSWTAGLGSTGTVVRAKYGEAPTNPTDGYAVYTGALTTATDWIPNIEFSDNTLWYSAWAYNGVGYSLTYATASVEGGAMASATATIAVALFFIMGVGLNIGGYLAKKWWLCPVAFFYWIGLGWYCYSQSDAYSGTTAFDFYRFLLWVCGMFALVSIGELWVLYRMNQTPEEPPLSMQQRNQQRIDRNLANTFNRTPVRKPPTRRPSDDVGEF